MPEPLDDKQAHRLVLAIAEQLAGLNMLEVEHVLTEARKLVFMTTYADPTSEAFQEQVRAYNEHFRDNWQGKQKQ